MRRSFSTSPAGAPSACRLLQQVVAVDRDAGQRVVELVHDAGRELAERRELLGVDDLLFELAQLGHVAVDVDHPFDVAVGAEHRRGVDRDLREAAVAARQRTSTLVLGSPRSALMYTGNSRRRSVSGSS